MLRKIINLIKARRVLWFTVPALVALALVDIKILLLGVAVYFPLFRLYTLMYHEYQVHQYIKPKHELVEWFGYFIMAVWEWSSPENKVKFHELHHKYFQDDDNDPTVAKLKRAPNPILYCLDLTPHVPIKFDTVEYTFSDTRSYRWFNQYWFEVMVVTLAAWLIFLPFWTFLAFYCFPVFVWQIIYRTTDVTFHHYYWPDVPLFCLYLGTSAYHGRHHLDDSYSRATYYGKGYWKYLNIDYYITGLMFNTCTTN